jgi:hypothetical protein
MRKTVSLAIGAAAVSLALLTPATALAAPAAAGHASALAAPPPNDPDTTTTFSVTSGALTMTAPATANLGSGAPGTTISGPLGTVTVNDARALLTASWTATVSSTTWVTGGGTGAEVIQPQAATYAPGTVTTTGTISVNPQTVTLSTSPQPVVTASSGTGNNTASWDPTISIAVPPAAVNGTYTATVVHSVT